MSNTENTTPINPANNPDSYKHFAFIVDGEVGHVTRFVVHETYERSIACLSSNPTVVEITGEMRGLVGMNGWSYDGTTFVPTNG